MTALVLALLGGTAAAFAVTEALKIEGLPLNAPRFTGRFSPVCACATDVAELSLRFRVSDTLTVVIVDRNGVPVRTLAEERPVRRGRVTFRWNGLRDDGRLVPDGPYRLRVHLDDEHRTILVPNEVQVDTKPPRVRIVRVRPPVLSPDGDGLRDQVRVTYRASERAGPVLLADGVSVGEWRPRQRKSFVVWNGRIAGAVARPGPHQLSIRVRDEAGNLSEPSDLVTVRLRFVDLARAVVRVERGGRIRLPVDADARALAWTLRRLRPGGSSAALLSGATSRRVITVRLPPRLPAGRYVLRVTAGRHSARAFVLVRSA